MPATRPLSLACAVLLPWGMLCWHLSLFWLLAPQYQYGWLVPPLAAYLFFRRWRSLTLPEASGGEIPEDGAPGAAGLALGCALLILPAWLVRTATPDWSVIAYCLAALVTGYTLAILALCTAGSKHPANRPHSSAPGGAATLSVADFPSAAAGRPPVSVAAESRCGGWRLARSMAFPVLFVFCAVPWPQRFENSVIQPLMRFVAAASAELLLWCGIAAEQAGNLVLMGNATVGISEACSGVRSIQSMLMAALFLGELRRLRVTLRLALVVIGIALALAFNLVRNAGLALLIHRSGPAAFERWHDSAGWFILLISFACLLFLAKRFRNATLPAVREDSAERLDSDSKTEDRQSGSVQKLRIGMPPSASLGLIAWFLAVIVGNELWYRAHEHRADSARRLEIRWPQDTPAFRTTPIPDRARDISLCSAADSASWLENDGRKWTFTSLRWAPGRTASESARIHQPDVCLQAIGAAPVHEVPPVTVPVTGGALVFRAWLFSHRNRPLFVFYTLWEDVNTDQANPALRQDWTAWSRIQRVLVGQRNRGQQSVEIALEGYDSEAEAILALKANIRSIVSLVPARLPNDGR